MPFIKPYKPSATHIKEWKSLKNGTRHAVFKTGQGFYKGKWTENKKSEVGYFVSKQSMYEGSWSNDKRHGFGIFSRKREDGSYNLWYDGLWKVGKPHGKGVRYYSEGSVYEGNFIKGKRQGLGRIWYSDGSFYEGQWYNDKRHGVGLFVYPNGSRYEGKWASGMKNGEGIFHHLCTGQDQIGYWSDDICLTSEMIDSPYRQAALAPTQHSIPTLREVTTSSSSD